MSHQDQIRDQIFALINRIMNEKRIDRVSEYMTHPQGFAKDLASALVRESIMEREVVVRIPVPEGVDIVEVAEYLREIIREFRDGPVNIRWSD